MVGNNRKEIIDAKIEVEFETLSNIESLFGSLEAGQSLQLNDGEIELKLISAGDTIAFDGGFTAEILISFSVGVASGVVGNVVYAALCGWVKKLTFDERRTRMTEESITQVIETKITTVSVSKKSH